MLTPTDHHELLPKRRAGRQTAAAAAVYQEQVQAFCDLIQQITWIDNLETSSGQQLDDPDHDDHGKEYVQDYIARFGVRKCEANALVVEPEVGRALCRDAILEHVPADAAARYMRKLAREREALRLAIRRRMGGGA